MKLGRRCFSAGNKDACTQDLLNAWHLHFLSLYVFFVLVDLLQAAGYFYSISQGSEMTVTFVQIAEKEDLDDKTKAMSTAMEKIGMLIPDVILLYASTREILELFLKKVRFCTPSPPPPPPPSFVSLQSKRKAVSLPAMTEHEQCR